MVIVTEPFTAPSCCFLAQLFVQVLCLGPDHRLGSAPANAGASSPFFALAAVEPVLW